MAARSYRYLSPNFIAEVRAAASHHEMFRIVQRYHPGAYSDVYEDYFLYLDDSIHNGDVTRNDQTYTATLNHLNNPPTSVDIEEFLETADTFAPNGTRISSTP